MRCLESISQSKSDFKSDYDFREIFDIKNAVKVLGSLLHNIAAIIIVIVIVVDAIIILWNFTCVQTLRSFRLPRRLILRSTWKLILTFFQWTFQTVFGRDFSCRTRMYIQQCFYRCEKWLIYFAWVSSWSRRCFAPKVFSVLFLNTMTFFLSHFHFCHCKRRCVINMSIKRKWINFLFTFLTCKCSLK